MRHKRNLDRIANIRFDKKSRLFDLTNKIKQAAFF